MRTVLKEIDIQNIINDYNNGCGIEAISIKFHVGKLKVKSILLEHGVSIRQTRLRSQKQYVVQDASIQKYKEVKGKHYLCTCIIDGYKTTDYLNKGGFLTSHLSKECGIEVPSLYFRNEYYNTTGNYWHEQYYTIELVDDAETIKCPYCDWSTIDIDNKSGMLETHIRKAHGITKQQCIAEHPEFRQYFKLANKTLDRQMETDSHCYVECAICGKKLSRIDWKHLKTHGITKAEYILRYGSNTISASYKDVLRNKCNLMNLAIQNTPEKFTSSGELELLEYIRSLGFISAGKNRSVLNGKELDIFIPEKNIAFEYDGCKWHTELFGNKNSTYHLSKTIDAQANGVTLIHIFEDEWMYRRDIVKAKIANILGVANNVKKVYARLCSVKEIPTALACEFLDAYHIQYSTNASIHYGGFDASGNLIGVMSFVREKQDDWNLVRFATNHNYLTPGLASKMFTHFIREHAPHTVKSFLDRRWCHSYESNLYTKLHFKLDGFTRPDYRYYNESVDKYMRFHKFNFRKSRLVKKYHLDASMTESEMVQQLGYDKIWDCGLARYIWNSDR